MKNWEKEFDKKFPVVVEFLPLDYKECLIEKGQTGVLFDIENDQRKKRALVKNKEHKQFIQDLLDKQKAEIREMIVKVYYHSELFKNKKGDQLYLDILKDLNK